MRTALVFSLLVFLLVACQSTGAPKVEPAPAPATNTTASVLPSPTPATTAPAHKTFTDADFAKHVASLKSEIKQKVVSRDPHAPAAEFSFVIQRPFVVIGDETKAEVQQHADDTVKWAVDRLKLDFFTNDPNEILDIWLFKDAASYEKHTRLFFNETPTTPYGYYSSTHKALIMNIGTGGGTLVHEIVHPFMEANFPACPPWLNEGMGSLYEHVGEENGHIYGYVNWRLPGLQRAIKAKTVPAFETLMAMDAQTFYGDRTGVNYAQSRYLCYYLQEKGLLVKFYKQFHAQQKKDPSGFETLKSVLGESDMVQFQKRWETFVLG